VLSCLLAPQAPQHSIAPGTGWADQVCPVLSCLLKALLGGPCGCALLSAIKRDYWECLCKPSPACVNASGQSSKACELCFIIVMHYRSCALPPRAAEPDIHPGVAVHCDTASVLAASGMWLLLVST
jgi:hypothetical protein